MMRMWQGAIGLATSYCMVSPAYVILRPKRKEDSTFYIYFFERNRSLYLFWAYSYGLTNDRLRLYFKDFSSIKIPTPLFSEQQKIASFLTVVDQRIQLLQRKKAKLEEYKKGVMQRLFAASPLSESGLEDSQDQHGKEDHPDILSSGKSSFRQLSGLEDSQDQHGKEGHPNILSSGKSSFRQLSGLEDSQDQHGKEGHPNILSSGKSSFRQLRFKDENGHDFPDWEEKKLGEVGKFFSGGTPTSTNKSYYSGEIPFIKSGEIGGSKTEQFLSEEGLKSSSAKIVEQGDLLMAIYGATSGEVAISEIRGAINQAIICIRGDFDNSFLHNWLTFNKDRITTTYLQGGQGNLSAEVIKSISIYLPSLPEQQKIASFLSSIDAAIEKVSQQIEGAGAFKKGLLQRMFV